MKANERIEYRQGLRWQLAVLIEHKPYYQRGGFVSDGWYVQNLNADGTIVTTDPVTHITPSMGGWVGVNSMRKPSGA